MTRAQAIKAERDEIRRKIAALRWELRFLPDSHRKIKGVIGGRRAYEIRLEIGQLQVQSRRLPIDKYPFLV